MSRNLRALLLDFDGTIAETERAGQRVAYNLAFAELGLNWYWDETLYGQLLQVAGGKERLRFYVESFRPELLDSVSAGLIAAIHDAKIRHFSEIAPNIPLRPGVLRLIREAHKAGVAVAIVTTASLAGVQALLGQHVNLPDMVDLIAANEAVERKKPAPDVYLWAMRRLQLSSEQCVAIEDSNVGLRAAKAAAVTTIITISDFTAYDDFADACAVLSDLGEPASPARSFRGQKPIGGLVDLRFLQDL